ncbi:tetratricopeptide repeat protein [Sphaerotilus sp.]|uniref:tetratricopeptide repeat protein n=1 Tax=Sphaerotilus sp. TaxID=2093942 RepID=UPI002ACE9616|nr:tetratricopeptide repeat protein [Sphaerotilus sp.]MDZ7859004.1 tetratricopeptide repeat protein [Sphaerotilus sp.]
MVAPDATGLRARILSTSGLLAVSAMVLVLLVTLYPRQELIERLRGEPRNDALSVSYLANLLSSEPDNDELRILLAERHFALKQADRAEQVLSPLQTRAPAGGADTALRLSRLRYSLLELRANAALPGSDSARLLRAQLVDALRERLALPWSTPDLLLFARKATALEQLPLAQRFHALIRFDDQGAQAPWFEEAVRTAIWAQDYQGAVTLHQRAMQIAPSEAQRRWHLREGLRILQSGNLLGEALTLARRHDDLVGRDAGLLDYLTRLALAANRPDQAQDYARRLLQMNGNAAALEPPRTPVLPDGLGWVAALVEALVSPAQAQPMPAPVDADRGAVPADAAGDVRTRPEPGDPRLPFEDTSYLLAYQTFLAGRNLNDAWRVAASAVRQAPEQHAWRERLAQVSEWVGRPQDALQQWRTLAQQLSRSGAAPREQREMLDRALQGVLRLAPSLNDEEVLLQTWTQIAALRPLTVKETLDVVALTERLGRPEEGMGWLVESDRRQPARALLEMQVDLAERMGELPTAIDALRRLIAREGTNVPRAMRLATFHGMRGEAALGHEALSPLSATTSPQDTAYWRLLGQMAWSLQREDQALHALTQITRHGDFNAFEADRLLGLLLARDRTEAARFAETAWQRLRMPGYLLAALEQWWNLQDLAQMERLFNGTGPAEEALVADEAYFWTLRAQWHQARGNMAAAKADLLRAMEAEPGLIETRVAYLALLIDTAQHQELQQRLLAWHGEAEQNPLYDAAYAAGYMALDQPRRALPFWRRQAPALREDALWVAAYADVLDAAGQGEAAARVRVQALMLTRRRLQGDSAGTLTAEQRHTLQLQLARLQLARATADEGLRTLRGLLAPGGLLGPGTATASAAEARAAQDLTLGWLLSNERHDQTRWWLGRRQTRALAAPVWAEMTLALHEGDLSTVRALLDGPHGNGLPVGQRIEALQALGRTRQAQTLRIDQLGARDDDGLHEAYADTAWQAQRRFTADLNLQRDSLRTTEQSVALALPLTETALLHLHLQDRHQRTDLGGGRTPSFGTVAAHDRTASATLQWRPDRALQLDGTLGLRSAERNTIPSLAFSATVQPMARLQLRADLGLQTRAPDSTALSVAGLQNEARLSGDLRLTLTNPVRVTVRAAQFGLQGGGSLGSALGLDWEVGQVIRGGTPDLGLRLFGNYTRYRQKDGALPDWTSRLTTDGQRPGASYFVPDSFALHGIGLSAGLSSRDAYQRPWRPYLDLSLTHHSRLGVGHAFTVGASGRLTGADQLQLQFSTTRAGSSGDARSFGVRYVRPF